MDLYLLLMPQVNIKTFILICFFVLLIPLLLAAHSLSGGDDDFESATLEMRFNSSSQWTQLRVEGASIDGIKKLSDANLSCSDNTIYLKNSGEAKVKVKINAFESPIKFSLSKDSIGQAFVEIKDVGVLENTGQPLAVPIHLHTDSSFAKLKFQGINIKEAKINDSNLTEVVPIIVKDSITIDNPKLKDIDINLVANLSFDDELATIVLEKDDGGIFWAKMNEHTYENNKNGNTTVRNLPVTVEMTSNKTQIFFDGGEIIKGTLTYIDDHDLQGSVIGNDFIYLKYSNDGNNFRRATYLLDLNLSQNSKLVIYKNSTGFVNVKLGEISYSCTDINKVQTYLSESYDLTIKPRERYQERKISVPLTIETTSDWTDISLNGFEDLELIINKIEGDISKPTIFGDSISITRKTPGDSSFAKVEMTLEAKNQLGGRLEIEKGDIGSTMVKINEMAVFNNAENIKRTSRNSMLFALPKLPKTIDENKDVICNPVAYIIPTYALLYANNLDSIEETQNNDTFLAVPINWLPLDWNIHMRSSVAKGVISYVLLSYLILSIFGLYVLIREGHLSYTPENKISWDYLWKSTIDSLNKLPISSVIILEALVALAITPFLLLKSDTMANGTAILAYLLLVAGVIIRFTEMKGLLHIDKYKEMLIKILSLAVLIAAGYIGIFELPKTPIVLNSNGLFGMLVITGIFLWLVYLSISRENLWVLVMSILQKIPISFMLIIEAMIILAIVSFIYPQSSESSGIFNMASIVAYLLLVSGIVTRFVETSDKLQFDEQKEILFKILSLAIFVAAMYLGIFRLLRTPIMLSTSTGLVVMFIVSGIFLWFVYLYLKESAHRDEVQSIETNDQDLCESDEVSCD